MTPTLRADLERLLAAATAAKAEAEAALALGPDDYAKRIDAMAALRCARQVWQSALVAAGPDLLATLAALEAEVSAWQKSATAATAELREQDRDLDGYERANGEQAGRIVALMAERDAAEARAAELESEHFLSLARADRAETRADSLAEQLDWTDEKRVEFANERDAANARVAALEAENERLRAEANHDDDYLVNAICGLCEGPLAEAGRDGCGNIFHEDGDVAPPAPKET